MKRIALALSMLGALSLAPASAPAEEPSANPPATAYSATAADQAVIVPVDRYVYRYRPGWYAPRYYGPYYSYRPYGGWYYPRRYYYYPGPYVDYGYHYPGDFNFFYSGPRRSFSFGF